MIVVTGVTGQLGHAFRKRLGESAVYLDRGALDLESPSAIERTIRDHRPDLVINCAAYTKVDLAETERDLAFAVNSGAVGTLAAVCREVGARFVTYSTDYVFDGSKVGAYTESDTPGPINVYGESKREGEERALSADPDALVIRTSWVMSATHRSFASVMYGLIERGDVKVVADQQGRATFVDDLAAATMDAVDAGVTGLLHVTNEGDVTWFEIAQQIAEIAGFDRRRVHPCTTDEYPTAAVRPRNSVLASERATGLGLVPMRRYEEPLAETIREIATADRDESPR